MTRGGPPLLTLSVHTLIFSLSLLAVLSQAEHPKGRWLAKRQMIPSGRIFASAPIAPCVPPPAACACPPVPAPVYAPVGCAPPLPAPMPFAQIAPAVPAAPPLPTGRLIPQALPGAPCEPGVECTGGSVCSMGICLCPPELVQEGTVCVSRTVYGVAPPGPPPMPFAPAPAVGAYPSPMPMPAPIAPATPPCYAPAFAAPPPPCPMYDMMPCRCPQAAFYNPSALPPFRQRQHHSFADMFASAEAK